MSDTDPTGTEMTDEELEQLEREREERVDPDDRSVDADLDSTGPELDEDED